MNVPHFISDPVTETELETARLLAKGKKEKEIADERNLGYQTIKAHSRSLRFKLEVNSIPRAINRMQILKFIPHELNHDDFPTHWRQYILPE
jgi:DNA-binding NarL/FixJ family response regulator